MVVIYTKQVSSSSLCSRLLTLSTRSVWYTTQYSFVLPFCRKAEIRHPTSIYGT